MIVKLLIAGFFVGAALAGALCGQTICTSIPCRSTIGILFGRGKLLALAQGSGLYEADVIRAARESRYVRGANESESSHRQPKRRAILSGLIAEAMIANIAREERIGRALIDREFVLLQFQLPRQVPWIATLRANGFSTGSLRRKVAENLRATQWIDRQLASQIETSSDECLRYYQSHLQSYFQPIRFRASHLFLAAPAETAPEIVQAKQRAMETLAARINQGEKFDELVAESSEDEATKARGGDLGFFSELRMVPEFFATIRSMRVGEISQVVRTRLGFHIIQLKDSRPARQMSFDESRLEISLILEKEKRGATHHALVADVSGRAEFVRFPL